MIIRKIKDMLITLLWFLTRTTLDSELVDCFKSYDLLHLDCWINTFIILGEVNLKFCLFVSFRKGQCTLTYIAVSVLVLARC